MIESKYRGIFLNKKLGTWASSIMMGGKRYYVWAGSAQRCALAYDVVRYALREHIPSIKGLGNLQVPWNYAGLADPKDDAQRAHYFRLMRSILGRCPLSIDPADWGSPAGDEPTDDTRALDFSNRLLARIKKIQEDLASKPQTASPVSLAARHELLVASVRILEERVAKLESSVSEFKAALTDVLRASGDLGEWTQSHMANFEERVAKLERGRILRNSEPKLARGHHNPKDSFISPKLETSTVVAATDGCVPTKPAKWTKVKATKTP